MKMGIVSIDVECDKGDNWIIQYPFTSIQKTLPNLLEPLFLSRSIPATYLLSPEILSHEPSVRILQDIAKTGAELGTHLHAEFIEPQSMPIHAAVSAH